MTKFQFKMADGRHVGKCWKCYNSPTNRSIWTKLGWLHSPRHARRDAVAMATAIA